MSEEAEQVLVIPPEIAALTQGQIINKMLDIREQRSALAKRDSELVQEWRVYEAALLKTADEQGIDRFSNADATATVTFETLPQLVDMDQLWLYMKENDAPHLLQRRVSASAFRELTDAGIEVPGLTPYVQRKISLRKR